MRTTSSFEIFPNDASERDLAKARWFRREGRLREAEEAYRKVMNRQPGLRTGWTECFDLLRRSGQADEALSLATDAEQIFAAEGFPMALKGAALTEQRRFREALEALDVAVARDPDLALTWHELGYAAHRIGDGSRALLALDRAFALEPHTETLSLRGRILREAGEFYAATVAFEAAMHSATHEEQRAEIEREVLVTQRLGDFAPRRPRDLTEAEQWFAEHGTVVLAAVSGGAAPTTDELALALVNLARDRDWDFGQVIAADTHPAWQTVADALDAGCEPLRSIDPARLPLLVAECAPVDDQHWTTAVRRIREEQKGAVFVAWDSMNAPPDADVIGALMDDQGTPLELGIDAAVAVVMAQHPGGSVAGRELTRPVSEAEAT